MTREQWIQECAARLKTARAAAGMTQFELAKAAPPLTPSHISMIESGHRGMQTLFAITLGKALSVSASYLLALPESDEARGAELSDEERHLLASYRKLSAGSKDAVAGVVRSLK